MFEAESETRYRVNAPDVLEESVGGEVLIINLASGAYYSAERSGEAVWRLLAYHANGREIVDILKGRFHADPDLLSKAVRDFKEYCLAESLLVPGDGEVTEPRLRLDAAAQHEPFDLPILKKYTDMADLLLLDPVHDAGEGGWPQPRQA